MSTAITSGQRLTAAAINAAANAGVSSLQTEITGAGTTTSTTYTGVLTGVALASQVFTAPPTGNVFINNGGGIFNNTAGQDVWVSFEVREGNVIGSGFVKVAASDGRAIRIKAASTTNDVQLSAGSLVTGLTAGAVYHVRQMARVGGGTGTVQNKVLSVIPAP